MASLPEWLVAIIKPTFRSYGISVIPCMNLIGTAQTSFVKRELAIYGSADYQLASLPEWLAAIINLPLDLAVYRLPLV